MELWTKAIKPAELSVYARKSISDVEAAKGNLGVFFPPKTVDDTVVKYERTIGGLEEAAEYRAFDAESSIAGSRGGERVTLELPPVSRKTRIGELDQLRSRAMGDDPMKLKVTIAKETDRVVKMVSERLEFMRGRVLETAKIDIDEGGFKVKADLGRSSSLSVTAATKWNNGGDPISDLAAWVEAWIDANNGETPGSFLGARKILAILQRNTTIQKMIKGAANASFVTVAELNALLEANNIPTFVPYDRKVMVKGKVQPVLSPTKILILPEQGTDKLGNTVFGRTAEAGDPEYGFASSEMPGLVASAHRSHDPYAHWVRANAIALPVMTNPNAALVADVLSA